MSVGRINVGNMNKAQVIGGSVFTAGLLAFSVWTFGPLVALGATAPISPAVVTVIPEATVTPTATPTPTVAPVAPVVVVPAPVVVDPAPVVEAPPAAPTYGASGYPVPFIPSSDPQNAGHGDYDVSICINGSASTSPEGIPLCD